MEFGKVEWPKDQSSRSDSLLSRGSRPQLIQPDREDTKLPASYRLHTALNFVQPHKPAAVSTTVRTAGTQINRQLCPV